MKKKKVTLNLLVEVELKNDQGTVLAILPVSPFLESLVPEVGKLIGPHADLEAAIGTDTSGQNFVIEFRPGRGMLKQ